MAYCEKCGKYSGRYPLCKDCYYAEDIEETAEEEKNEDLTCPICGGPTSVYYGNARKDRLCQVHAKMLKSELIELNENGLYISKITQKILNKNYNKDTQEENQQINTQNQNAEEFLENNVIIINEENKSKCITCGKKTEGLLFCTSCYHKYKNKELLFKITACSAVELLDENYEGRYTCKDGHVVKSKSEREIDNYLFEKGIPHAYEKSLPYGKTDKETLHPDFYLPHYLGKDKHVYIEHWGYNENNLHYHKTKAFKIPIYEKLGVTLICTYEKTDAGDIDSALDRKLNKDNIEEGKINHPN